MALPAISLSKIPLSPEGVAFNTYRAYQNMHHFAGNSLSHFISNK